MEVIDMNDIDKRIEYTCQALDVGAIDCEEAVETIKSIITEQQEVIRQMGEALELHKQIDGRRYVDEKDKRAAERGFRRKRDKALALVGEK